MITLLIPDTKEIIVLLTSLQTMDVQHFHHELVKRAMVLGMDKGERERALVIELFEHLSSVGLLTSTQLKKGINRVFSELNDLKLDVPEAETFFYNYISRCIERGLLSENFSPSVEEGSPSQTEQPKG